MLSVTGIIDSSHGNFVYGVGIGSFPVLQEFRYSGISPCQMNQRPHAVRYQASHSTKTLVSEWPLPGTVLSSVLTGCLPIGGWGGRGGGLCQSPWFLLGVLLHTPSGICPCVGQTLQRIKHGETSPVCHHCSLMDPPTMTILESVGCLLAAVQKTIRTIFEEDGGSTFSLPRQEETLKSWKLEQTGKSSLKHPFC